ncbi:MAG: hypothetical protein Q9190_003292 [Brigantiaea leucoxantha]
MDPLSVTGSIVALYELTRRSVETWKTLTRDGEYDELALQLIRLVDVVESIKQILDSLENNDGFHVERYGRQMVKRLLQSQDIVSNIATTVKETGSLLEDQYRRPKLSRRLWNSSKSIRIREASSLIAAQRSLLETYLNLARLTSHQTFSLRARTLDELTALDWLSSSDPEATQLDLQDHRLKSSGAWLHDDDQYRRWLGPSPSDNILWLTGFPGSGKTYLASFIVDDLKQAHGSSRTPVTYFYCDYRQVEIHSAAYILSSLLKQLVFSMYPLPQPLLDLFSSYQRGTDSIAKPRLADVWRVFLIVAQTFDRVFIVVDALDECDSHHRAKLLGLIPEITSSVRLLITSRYEADIVRKLRSYPQLALSTINAKKDIEDLLAELIKRTQLFALLDSSSKKQGTPEQAKKDLVNEIYRKSEGS